MGHIDGVGEDGGGEGGSICGGSTDVEASDNSTAGQTPRDTTHRHANAELSSVVYILILRCVCVCARAHECVRIRSACAR